MNHPCGVSDADDADDADDVGDVGDDSSGNGGDVPGCDVGDDGGVNVSAAAAAGGVC